MNSPYNFRIPFLIFDKTSSSSKEKIKASEADIETEWDGTQSAKKLHQMMKAKGYKVSLKSKYSPIISPNKLHVVQMDLVDMTKQGKRFNKGNGFMMTAIDVWSRYAYATPHSGIGDVPPIDVWEKKTQPEL